MDKFGKTSWRVRERVVHSMFALKSELSEKSSDLIQDVDRQLI